MEIAEQLDIYDFTNFDGSTFGEAASTSFDEYVVELALDDVRSSREKTIEAVVLGEKMKSILLYNEAFVHAAGRFEEIQHVGRSHGAEWKFGAISDVTRNRLERASIDLHHRERTVDSRLVDFEFPSIFAGIMNSRMADERKVLQFGAWKDAFLAARKHVLAYYRHKYGSWPPKARGKKHNLATSGLNRMVIKALYQDFSDLYDLWVDRASLTTRNSDITHNDSDTLSDPDPEEPTARILRRVFDEYDRSSPPVQPAVPFDLPLSPSLYPIRNAAATTTTTITSAISSRTRAKKLKDDTIPHILNASSNVDTLPKLATSPFLASMRHFEHRHARGATIADLANLRTGAWILCYAVLQALPMLAVDAPGVRHSRGVEYFLCEPPRSGAPWLGASAAGVGGARGRQSWYGIAGGAGGVVSLPSDLVEHGVEGVYRRSHCWLQAAKWAGVGGDDDVSLPAARASKPPSSAGSRSSGRREEPETPLLHVLAGDTLARSPTTTRTTTRGSTARDSVLSLGLEALPLPSGVVMSPGGSRNSSRTPASAGGSRAASVRGSRAASVRGGDEARNSGRTFDDIFRDMGCAG